MSKKTANQEAVLKALDELEGDTVSKASEGNLDQPEGADMGAPGDKMSDAAKSKKKPAMKKAEDEDMDDEGEDKEDLEMSKKKAMKGLKKSVESEDEEVQAKIEVSDFLKSLVDKTAGSLKNVTNFIAKSDAAHAAQIEDVKGDIAEITKSLGNIGVVLKALCETVGVIQTQPARAAKADQVSKSEGDKPAAREFKSAEADENKGGEEKMFKSLSDQPAVARRQMSGALTDMVMKSEAGATDLDVINFETSGYIRPELVPTLKEKLK